MGISVGQAVPLPKERKKKPAWVGQQVIVKRTGLSMRPTADASDSDEENGTYITIINPTVLSETEDSVEIHSGGQNGFIKKSQVVRAVDGTAYFDQALEEQPQAIDMLVRRASLHRLLKQFDLAVNDYNRAIEISGSAALYQNRGTLHVATHEYEKALDDFNTCIRLNPNFSAGFRSRALIHERMYNLDDALADYEKANEFGADGIVLLGLGRVWAMKGNHEKATEYFTKTIEINPKSPPGYGGRGRAYLELGQLDKARADYNAAIRLAPNLAYGFQQRAGFHAEIGDARAANYDSAEALRTDPDDESAMNTRAWFLATCPDAEYRNPKRAVALARKACELSRWKVPSYIDTLSAALAANNEFDEAISTAEKALTMANRMKDNGKETKDKIELYKKKQPYLDQPKFKPKETNPAKAPG
jgi:tetratricopeptide (TPR) repeat protein